MTEKKLLASTRATNRYKAKKQAKRYNFDLYLDDDNEKKLAEILDKQLSNKKFKQYIINAIKHYEKLE